MSNPVVPYWIRGTRLGSVVIIDCERASDVASERVYRVRHDCCDRVESLSHDVIRRRLRDKVMNCTRCGRKRGGHASRRGSLLVKDDPGFRVIAEMPEHERPKVPSAAYVLGIWEAANARVGAR